MNEQQLIEALKTAASDLSYYNAAEGDSWAKEASNRGIARNNFNKALKACQEAGIKVNDILAKGGYLI